MIEETAKQESKPAAGQEASPATTKVKKKKQRPTNCLQSNKRIRRKDWYYRDGHYFANKKCFKLWVAQEAEKAKKAAVEASAKAQTSPAPAANQEKA